MPNAPPLYRPPNARTKRDRDRDYKRKRRNDPDQAFLRKRDWRDRLRPTQLTNEPFCRMCAAGGRVALATEVDHIVPPRGDSALQRDPENFQSLCATCHGIKTRAQPQGGG